MSSIDVILIVQIAIAAVVVPLLVSGALYFFWPNVWHYFADKMSCVCSVLTYPCVVMCKCCSGGSSKKQKHNRHEPHYIGPDRMSSEDPLRQSRTKTERKLRVENKKRREMSAAEELSVGDQPPMNRMKAQATRVEKKPNKQPTEGSKVGKKKSGFKYQFQEEEKLSEEVNPYLHSGSSSAPPSLVERDVESGTTEEDRDQEQDDPLEQQ